MSNNHPPTYEIRVKHVGAGGEEMTTTHFVWDSNVFMQARMEECKRMNADHLKETGKLGIAKVELL